jgi:hypothetical protein
MIKNAILLGKMTTFANCGEIAHLYFTLKTFSCTLPMAELYAR